MAFGDLKSDSGLTQLNNHLRLRSYIEGFTASQADVAIFEVIGKEPNSKFENALRWYKHINSLNRAKLPGQKASGEAAPKAEAKKDDDFDMFGSSDEEDEAAKEEREKRLADYKAKKSGKPTLIAKSNIILDIKPWDDETNMAEVERLVRTIECDGLLWGQAKLVPLAYGIKKLQISCVVEDDKVGTDFLEEEITKFEDLVQSVDVAAFNKI